jgi:hypothetical protein
MPRLWRIPLTFPLAIMSIAMLPIHSVSAQERSRDPVVVEDNAATGSADADGSVKAAVVEFGGFLGIGTRKIAIAWPDLRFDTEGEQLIAILDIPRDQLRLAKDYKPDAPAIVTKVIEPLSPSTEEPPNKVTEPPPPAKEIKPSRKRKRQHRLY